MHLLRGQRAHSLEALPVRCVLRGVLRQHVPMPGQGRPRGLCSKRSRSDFAGVLSVPVGARADVCSNAIDQTFSLPGSPTPGTRQWISFGSVEQERLLNYVSRNNISWETIGAQVVQVILGPNRALEGVRNLCKGCASTMFEASLMRWWIWYQEHEHIADDRVNCWYGYTCRTQTHNRIHAARYVPDPRRTEQQELIGAASTTRAILLRSTKGETTLHRGTRAPLHSRPITPTKTPHKTWKKLAKTRKTPPQPRRTPLWRAQLATDRPPFLGPPLTARTQQRVLVGRQRAHREMRRSMSSFGGGGRGMRD